MSATSLSGSEGAFSSHDLAKSITMAPSSCTSVGSVVHANGPSRPGSRDSSNNILDLPLARIKTSPKASGISARDLAVQDKIKRLDGVVSKIDHFIQAQDEVTGFRIASQQKHKAIEQARGNVAKSDKAFIDALRKARVDLPYDLLHLVDSLEEARNKLGPLEHDMDRLEFRQVTKEYELKEEGEKIRRQYLNVVRDLPADQDESDEQDETSSYASSEGSTSLIKDRALNSEVATSIEPLGRLNDANNEQNGLNPGTIEPSTWTLADHISLLRSTAVPETRRGIGNIETNLDLFAPDLSRESPWTLHYAKHLDSYVQQSHNGGAETDVLEPGDPLLQTGDTEIPDRGDVHVRDISAQEPGLDKLNFERFQEQRTLLLPQIGIFSYSAAIFGGGVGGLVNGWLRSVLHASRFEMMLLGRFIATGDKDDEVERLQLALQFWNKDGTVDVPLAPRTTSPNVSEVRRYSDHGSTVVSPYSRIISPSLRPGKKMRTTWSGEHEIYLRPSSSFAPLILEVRRASRAQVRTVS